MVFRYFSFLFIVMAFTGCMDSGTASWQTYRADSLLVEDYISQGDKIYSRKSNYGDFFHSLELYDSAFSIAEKQKDTLLLAKSIFAKGRAYDALNRDPQKTIDAYTAAATFYASIPHLQNEALYIRHLVAHAYDKVGDSSRCINELQRLYNEIVIKPDSVKKQLHFTSEMALISTVVRNYEMANLILQNLTKRPWIANDPTEYDYLNHYYLTRARMDIFGKAASSSPYLDSLEMTFNSSRNFSDSSFFSNELITLFRACNNPAKVGRYEIINFRLNEQLTAQNSSQKIQSRLSEMEVASVETKRKEVALSLKNRTRFAWLLAAVLLAISAFAFFLIKKNREIFKKKKQLQRTNALLHEKDLQNELLNKEIHHRVKNNLQMIMSLVYMQERTTQTEEAKSNLQDIRLRIEGVAALHEQLMEKDNQPVDLREYVTRMVNAVAGLVKNNQHIFTHLDIEAFTFPLNKSFPVGQILNEWITNTIKHAANADGNLVIYVTIKKVEDSIVVHYRDSGEAVAPVADSSKLGLSIINLLVAQLNGKLTVNPDNHFNYNLTFPFDGE